MSGPAKRRRARTRKAGWILGASSSPHALDRLAAAETAVEDQTASAGLAVMEALSTCLRHGLVVPHSVAAAFVARVEAVAQARAASWDVAFGEPHPGCHVDDECKARQLVEQVHAAVWARRTADPSCPISRESFESVGEALAGEDGAELSGPTVERIYNRALALGYPNASQRIPHVRKSRRGRTTP
jgi:hypothetical protein